MTAKWDRTVHGRTWYQAEIVRYNQAGKWYIEYPVGTMIPSRHIRLAEAVSLAVRGQAFLGMPGGSRFDAGVRKARQEPTSAETP